MEIKVGTSFISIEQARRNLDREVSDKWRIEDTARACRQQWKDALEVVKLEGEDADRENKKWKRVFYSERVFRLRFVDRI